MREIGKMITQVQDASLGEHRIRDLNDDINKMIRVKKAWEFRIKEVRLSYHLTCIELSMSFLEVYVFAPVRIDVVTCVQ